MIWNLEAQKLHFCFNVSNSLPFNFPVVIIFVAISTYLDTCTCFLGQAHFSASDLNLCLWELLILWQGFRLVFHAGGVAGVFFRPGR